MYQARTNVTPQGYPANDPISFSGRDSCGVHYDGGKYSGKWQYVDMLNNILTANGSEGMNGFVRYFDNSSSTPFLYNSATQDFIAYEDAQSIALKNKLIIAQGLSGV